MSTKTLKDLGVGQAGRVISITGTDAIAMRLMEMGIFEGELISMLGSAPLGDPREYEVCGSQISLRNVESERVLIEFDSP